MSETERRTVVITGGTAGIGRATAREFARHGFNVAVLARGADGLAATRLDIEQLGGRALAVPTDVADWKAVEAAADQVERELGPIDVWVNNAFAGIFSRFMDVTPEEYQRVTEVTYLGQVNGTRAALKRMLPRKQGKIVLVGSALAYRGIPLQSAYCGAKHAIQGFIDSVRCELLHDQSNVTITMVQMPGVNTPQFDWIRAKLPGQPRPVGKVYQPEVAARAIYAAAHDTRKEMLIGLPTVEAVWGNKVASSLMDDYLAATGFASQQRPERVSPDRKDNLFAPVAGDHGARGSFDEEAVDNSAQLWATEHKRQLGLAALGLAAVAGAGFMFSRSTSTSSGTGGKTKARERS
jgi:NAD(P)-dependent dehydrogenase (short-subunit alcohol dehydrogenase family)